MAERNSSKRSLPALLRQVFASINFKLSLAFMLVGILGIVLVAVALRQSTVREFDRFVRDRLEDDVVEDLATYYQVYGTFEGVDYMFASRPGAGGGGGGGGGMMGPVMLIDTDRVILFTSEFSPDGEKIIGTQVPKNDLDAAIPIEVEGETVGFIVFKGPSNRMSPGTPEGDFLSRMKQTLFVSAFAASLIALLLGIWLARTISRPVRHLTAATRRVAHGELGVQVEVETADEVGELAHSFNRMSADLAKSNDLRRQMTADIAHELRTPLSVILGYTEALSDGKLPGNEETYQVMYDEAIQLQRLIDDLRTLSLADAGELTLTRVPTEPAALLERVALSHRPLARREDISLEVETASDLPTIDVDPDRMAQVLANLIANALRYTPTGGEITLSAGQDDHAVWMKVRDSGSGISPENLPYVFNRFYKGDQARAESGASGLGLAIARSIVNAHGGEISVDSTPGVETIFTITFPV
ncbi:MAG: HAMP domain-containing histidine kinase [Anaerolineae bacterium]|nr:HAMP domain-containing histidine kinase [Anaerolineae bacterium]